MRRNFLPRTKAAVSAGAITATLLGGAVAAAPTASAASYPTCNSYKRLSGTGIVQPYYSGTGSRNCIMSHGSVSEAVRMLQISLVECNGVDTGGKDGIYGDKTRAAVRAVQSAAGNIDVDGIYGPDTRKAMDWYNWPGCKSGR